MELIALENFTCFPHGDEEPLVVLEGQEFEIEDEKYARLLIEKGHALET